jgi:hypothetical protein
MYSAIAYLCLPKNMMGVQILFFLTTHAFCEYLVPGISKNPGQVTNMAERQATTNKDTACQFYSTRTYPNKTSELWWESFPATIPWLEELRLHNPFPPIPNSTQPDLSVKPAQVRQVRTFNCLMFFSSSHHSPLLFPITMKKKAKADQGRRITVTVVVADIRGY